MLQSNYAPSFLLNWEQKKDFSTNRISYKPCLKHGKTVLHVYLQYNDTKKLMLKEEINRFKNAQIKNAFYFFPLLFLGVLSFKVKFNSTFNFFVLKYFCYLLRMIGLF